MEKFSKDWWVAERERLEKTRLGSPGPINKMNYDHMLDQLTFEGKEVRNQEELVIMAIQSGMNRADIAKMVQMLGFPKASPVPPLPPSFAGASGVVTNSAPSSDELCRMICMRMRFQPGQKLPMAYMSAHQSNANVFVFLVHNEQATIIEDEALMFPSDILITKLRLILG